MSPCCHSFPDQSELFRKWFGMSILLYALAAYLTYKAIYG